MAKRKRKKKQHRRVYKYQIREHPQNMRLGNMLDDLCDVHNHFLKLENRYYRIYGKYAGRYRLQPHLTHLLERTYKHWAWIPRDTLDAVIIRLHLAWERFFDIPGCGRPKFKRKGRYRSAKFQSAYLLEEGRVRLSFKEWDAPRNLLSSTNVGFLSISIVNGRVRSAISKSFATLSAHTGSMLCPMITPKKSCLLRVKV